MKVKFIYPKKIENYHAEMLYPRLWFPLLTFPILAAYTPDDVELHIVDEAIESIDFDDPVDLVGLTAFTHSAPRAYEIAAEYRKRGIKVVMGGFHVTAMPEEAQQHVDAVAIGEGEETWPVIIDDFKKGCLKPVYKAPGLFDLEKYRTPKMELISRYCPPVEKYAPPYYITLNIVEMSRGCPFKCDYCAVTHFYGNSFRFRPVEEVINEARQRKLQMRQRFVNFCDDNMFGNKTYLRQLMAGLKKLNVTWSGQVSINAAKDPEILAMMADSGCHSVGIGIESISQDSLQSVNKVVNNVNEYDFLLEQLKKYNIKAYIGMMVGFDTDNEAVIEKTHKWVQDRLEYLIYVHFHIMTPLPGTPLYYRLLAENRIFDFDWSHYDTKYVVFEPKLMSAEALAQGNKWLQDSVKELNLTNWKRWY